MRGSYILRIEVDVDYYFYSRKFFLISEMYFLYWLVPVETYAAYVLQAFWLAGKAGVPPHRSPKLGSSWHEKRANILSDALMVLGETVVRK